MSLYRWSDDIIGGPGPTAAGAVHIVPGVLNVPTVFNIDPATLNAGGECKKEEEFNVIGSVSLFQFKTCCILHNAGQSVSQPY